MRHLLRLAACVVVVSLLALAGCVEMVGQRLSLSYDAKTDTLKMLIFYDGIHEKARGDGGNGPTEIPKFVANGDIMFLDWYGRVQMKELQKVPNPNEPWSDVQVALVASLKTMPIGHYRDTRGRIGAAQLVTISKAGELIKKFNGAINQSSVSFDLPDMPRTTQLCKDAAAKDHQWLTLDGQALRFSFPIHPGEWRVAKAKGLWNAFTELQVGSKTEAGRTELIEVMRKAVSFLATSAISYEETDGMVLIRLGNRGATNTYRVPLHEEYEPSLEPVVVQNVPLDLDDAIARFVLNKVDKPAPGVAEVIGFGPPEVVPSALAHAATGKDGSLQDAAMTMLAAWAKQWNESQVVPAAPETFDELKWKDWLTNFGRIPDALMPAPVGAAAPAPAAKAEAFPALTPPTPPAATETEVEE